MATYPIKVLKDEGNIPFVPLVSTVGITDPQGRTLDDMLQNKLEKTNLIAGENITLSTSGNNITINNSSPGSNLINNLTTIASGQGSLDAYQGKILKDSIPEIVDNLTTVSGTKGLSAYQGYLLSQKIVPNGGNIGQVLKKKTGNDYDIEWGDAADPNAISGDGSIKKIIECTYEEYKTLENTGALDSNTEYHIPEDSTNNVLESTIKQLILEDNQRKYYVGKIIMDTMNVNPATYLGFGTWVLWGSGKVPVGVDTTDTDFNTVEKTGGEKTHTLSINEMPSHYHTNSPNGFICNTLANGGPGVWSGNSGNNLGSSNATMSTGGNQAHNNIQPYICVYMWKRTA